MLSLSLAQILAKNKLVGDGAWLFCAHIQHDSLGVDGLKITRNTDDVEWDGSTWTAFPFELEARAEAKKQEQSPVRLRISNIAGIVQATIDANYGLVGASVTMYLLAPGYGPSDVAAITLEYTVISATCDYTWATFSLGARSPYGTRFPRTKMIKNSCRFADFKGELCGYSGAETVCDKTLARCRELGNSERFGGFPGIGRGGVYV